MRKFQPTWESVKSHTLPSWYDDCKFGIFIHWGPYSVPAFAPPTCELGDIAPDEQWFCNNPYAEWYLNSIRTQKGPSYEHHCQKYGKTFEYENFTHMWKAENWQPEEWASLFKKAGAQYVVLTTKHHDGFCLWPSAYTKYNTGERGPKRDIMGDLTNAVRAQGLKMGAYYSGILDWSFSKEPILHNDELFTLAPVTYAYSDYALNQIMELIDRYKPSVLWNDIGWPLKGLVDLPTIFAHYYNTVADGVVDERWNDTWCDFTSKEYKQGEASLTKKWEMCRGLGLSFGYNEQEDDRHILSVHGLVSLLVETVAHNGNLLINVGPKADGTIPGNQAEKLLGLGKWLEVNAQGIYGTRPWTTQQEKCTDGIRLYYTQKEGNVYIFADNLRKGNNTFTLANPAFRGKTAELIGVNGTVTRRDGSHEITVLCDSDDNPPICVRVRV